jgi:hypothetical protein
MAALTGTKVVGTTLGHYKLTSFSISIAADNDTFASGISGIVDWWITSKTDGVADGPVVDAESDGTFTFGTAAAAAITLWIVHN